MKKQLLYWFMCIGLLVAFKGRAQAPNWQVNSADFAYQMGLVGALNLDGLESKDPNDLLAAFIDGECRGVSRLENIAAVNRHLAYVTVYHHAEQGVVTFKVYDASQNKVIDLPQTGTFEIQGVRGSTIKPIVYSFPRLSSEANFLTFALPGQESATISGTEITVWMKLGTDLKNLAAEFTASAQARVLVAGAAQESGKTAHDYSQPLTYRVISADESTEQEYLVTVKYRNAPPVLLTESVTVSALAAPGTEIARLEASDPDGDKDLIRFALVTPDVPFAISPEGRLSLTQVLNVNEQAEYTLKITLSDNSNLVEKNLKVIVRRDQELTLQISNLITPNDDNVNDWWQVTNGYLFQNHLFRVFDYQGKEVFFQKGYAEPFWNGTYQGKKLPTGTYIYLVQSPDKSKAFKGTLNILH